MVSTLLSSDIASFAATGSAVAFITVFVIIWGLIESSTNPFFSRLEHSVTVYALPLISLAIYLFIMASADALAD